MDIFLLKKWFYKAPGCWFAGKYGILPIINTCLTNIKFISLCSVSMAFCVYKNFLFNAKSEYTLSEDILNNTPCSTKNIIQLTTILTAMTKFTHVQEMTTHNHYLVNCNCRMPFLLLYEVISNTRAVKMWKTIFKSMKHGNNPQWIIMVTRGC